MNVTLINTREPQFVSFEARNNPRVAVTKGCTRITIFVVLSYFHVSAWHLLHRVILQSTNLTVLSSGDSMCMWKSKVVSSVFTVKLFLFTYTNNQKLDEGEKQEEGNGTIKTLMTMYQKGANVEGWHQIDSVRKEITSDHRLLWL